VTGADRRRQATTLSRAQRCFFPRFHARRGQDVRNLLIRRCLPVDGIRLATSRRFARGNLRPSTIRECVQMKLASYFFATVILVSAVFAALHSHLPVEFHTDDE
jgi:hypothetical protein